MRSESSIQATPARPPLDRAHLQHWLRERLQDLESARHPSRPTGSTPSVIPTGWDSVDADLPEGGLRRGAIHEWFGVTPTPTPTPTPTDDATEDAGSPGQSSVPAPPLLLLSHLAHRATQPSDHTPRGWTVWIGHHVWPSVHALGNTASHARSLFVDSRTEGDRLWAIDAALRCPGVVVVADGSSLNTAATRRLQLAAEATGTIAFLARPAHEVKSISVAATRWAVSPCITGGTVPRWSIRLLRCKSRALAEAHAPSTTRVRGNGLSSMVSHERMWMVERATGGGLVVVSPDVADRPRAAALAS